MDQPTVIRIPTDAGTAELYVTASESSTSPHTGSALWKVDAQAQTAPAVGEALNDLLSEARGDGGVITDADGRQWRVGNWQSRVVAGTPVAFGVELSQRAVLPMCERLTIASFDVVPSSYHEEAEDGAVIGTVTADLSAEQADALRQLHGTPEDAERNPVYFDVVRHGIQPEPRRMRLGRVLWQAAGEVTKTHFVLVEHLYDVDRKPSAISLLGEPRLSHALDWAGRAEVKLGALISELTAAGVLTAEAAERIAAAYDDDAEAARRWAESQVKNLTEWV